MNLLKFSNYFLKEILKISSGFRTLYHVRESGGLPFPVPKGEKKNWKRHWVASEPENGIWLTDNPFALEIEHSIIGKIHVFKISENIIAEAGGLHITDMVKEILISKELWEEGVATEQIKYLGAMTESKMDEIKKSLENYFKRKEDLLLFRPFKEKENDK